MGSPPPKTPVEEAGCGGVGRLPEVPFEIPFDVMSAPLRTPWISRPDGPQPPVFSVA